MASSKKGQNWCATPSSTTSFYTLPPAICQKELVITYVDSPSTFWGTLASQLGKQLDIENKLSDLCDSLPRCRGNAKFGKMYASKYSCDGLWYRCRVSQTISKSQVEVLYVDYGNKEVVSIGSLVELTPEVADLHVLAYPYWLLRAKNIQTDEAIERGIEIMEELKNTSSLNATLYSKTKNGVIPVTVVLDSGVDLTEVLVDKHICSYMNEEEMRIKFNSSVLDAGSKMIYQQASTEKKKSLGSSTISGRVNRREKNMRTSRMAASSPIVDGSSVSPSIANSGKLPPRAKSKSPVKLVKIKTLSERGGGIADYDDASKRLDYGLGGQDSSSELSKKRNLEFGIEQLSFELTESTNDVLYLQLANNNMKRELEECKGQLRTLEHRASAREILTSHKMKNIIISSKKVNRLRKKILKQNELKFELDRIGDVLLSVQPSNPMLRKIHSVQAVFDSLQRKIKSKSSVDEELNKLISARDSARKLLHHDIEEFLEKVSQFPLEETFAKIKEILADLSIKPERLKELDRGGISSAESFIDDSLMNVTSDDKFQSALLVYRTWRMGGFKDHRFIQLKMDDKKQQITQALNYVLRELNEEGAEGMKEDPAFSQLDSVMDDFIMAAEEEQQYMMKELGEHARDFSDQANEDEESREREGAYLWESVEGLLIEIKKVIEIVNRYRSLMLELGMWLDRVPDLTDLKNVMRNIRCYKSQLRHLLADHADMEEEKVTMSGSSDTDNRHDLMTKLSQTRAVLQERLELESQILVRMMVSDLRQFPELILHNTDIPFRSFLNFGPIVKHGRSLDQYTLEPFRDESDAFVSTYLGRPVLLKESLLRSMRPEHLEALVNQYMSIFEDPLAPSIDFIFFDMVRTLKKKQSVIVQSAYRDVTLAKLLTVGTDERILLYVMYNVLTCLSDMHRRGIVHGCINPSYIFYDSESWTAFLRPPDLTLTSYERARENSWSVWRYMAPEVSQGSASITTSVDMYSFGILLYQINKPNQPLEMYSDIGIILSKEPHSCLTEMIKLLLNVKADERPKAETLLKTQYWLDVGLDYEKGKKFLLKPNSPCHEQKSFASFDACDQKPSERKKTKSKLAEVRNSDDSCDQYDSEGDESLYSNKKFPKDRKKASKVKFAMTEDFEKSEDEDVAAVHRLNGVTPDKQPKKRSRNPPVRAVKTKQESVAIDDDVSSDGNTDASGSKLDDSEVAKSLSDASTISGDETEDALANFTFAKPLPSLEQRISGITRRLNATKESRFASSEDYFADDG